MKTVKTQNKTTALQVATVKIGLRNLGTQYRVLLDTGSQQTFIIKALAYKLQLKPVKLIKLQVEGFLGGTEYHTYDGNQPKHKAW